MWPKSQNLRSLQSSSQTKTDNKKINTSTIKVH